MRKLAVIEYVSLDGVVQAPGHAGEDPEGGFVHGGWTGPFMADHRRYNTQLFPTAGAFLFGRRTYEIFAEYWPTVTDEADRIAGALNSRPKYVASTTLRAIPTVPRSSSAITRPPSWRSSAPFAAVLCQLVGSAHAQIVTRPGPIPALPT